MLIEDMSTNDLLVMTRCKVSSRCRTSDEELREAVAELLYRMDARIAALEMEESHDHQD